MLAPDICCRWLLAFATEQIEQNDSEPLSGHPLQRKTLDHPFHETS